MLVVSGLLVAGLLGWWAYSHKTSNGPPKNANYVLRGVVDFGEFIPKPMPGNSTFAQSLAAEDGKTYLLQYALDFAPHESLRLHMADKTEGWLSPEKDSHCIAYGDRILTIAESGVRTHRENDDRLVLVVKYLEPVPPSAAELAKVQAEKAEAAAEKADSEEWSKADETGTVKTLDVFLNQFPASSHREKANAKRMALLADDFPFECANDLDWSSRKNTMIANRDGRMVVSLDERIVSHKDGRIHRVIRKTVTEEGKKQVQVFECDVTEGVGMDAAELGATRLREMLAQFIENYPGHKCEADALKKIEELTRVKEGR